MADIKICDRCRAVGAGDAIGAVGIIDNVSTPGPGGLKLKELCPDCVAGFHTWFKSVEAPIRGQLSAFSEPYRDASTPPRDADPNNDEVECGSGVRYKGIPVRCTLALGHELPAATRLPNTEYSERHYNSRHGNFWQ
jgi:hypothetical protein